MTWAKNAVAEGNPWRARHPKCWHLIGVRVVALGSESCLCCRGFPGPGLLSTSPQERRVLPRPSIGECSASCLRLEASDHPGTEGRVLIAYGDASRAAIKTVCSSCLGFAAVAGGCEVVLDEFRERLNTPGSIGPGCRLMHSRVRSRRHWVVCWGGALSSALPSTHLGLQQANSRWTTSPQPVHR